MFAPTFFVHYEMLNNQIRSIIPECRRLRYF